jgi:hypothetical protein
MTDGGTGVSEWRLRPVLECLSECRGWYWSVWVKAEAGTGWRLRPVLECLNEDWRCPNVWMKVEAGTGVSEWRQKPAMASLNEG